MFRRWLPSIISVITEGGYHESRESVVTTGDASDYPDAVEEAKSYEMSAMFVYRAPLSWTDDALFPYIYEYAYARLYRAMV